MSACALVAISVRMYRTIRLVRVFVCTSRVCLCARVRYIRESASNEILK